MKQVCLSLALVMTLNSVSAVAHADASISEQRSQELIELANSNPRKALASLSDQELLQMNKEIKELIIGLQADMAVAEKSDGDRLGYKITKIGKISALTVIALSAAGIWYYMGPPYNNPDNPAGVYLLVGIFGVAISTAVYAAGSVIIWLTPSEVAKVEEKISLLSDFSIAIEKKLK